MKSTQLICLSGAGGTGKTSVLAPLQRLLVGAGKKVEVWPSVTRKFYASRKIAGEADFLVLSDQERLKFQVDLYWFYVNGLILKMHETTADVVLADRAAFDHFAHIFATTKLTKWIVSDLSLGLDYFMELRPQVFYFGYPTPWLEKAADGFRAQDPGKDALIDAVIFKQWHRRFGPLGGYNAVPIWNVDRAPGETPVLLSPEQRAAWVFACL